MRNIVFKLGSFPHTSETFIINSIINCIKQGFKVSIIVDELLGLESSSQQELINKFNLIEKVAVFKIPNGRLKRRIRFLLICTNPILLFYFVKYCNYKKKRSLDYIFILRFYWKYRKNNIFHVHYGTMVEPIIFLKNIGFLKSKIIVTFHGYDAHFDQNTYETRKASYEDLFKHVDLVTTNTPYLKEQVLALGCPLEKIDVVPMPVDTEFFITSIENCKYDGRISLLSVGRLISLKGFIFGIEAVNKLIQMGYNVHYDIVGEGKERSILEKTIKDFRLEHNVRLLGKKNQKFIKEQLQKTDIFLMTSVIDATGRKEAQGVVTIEAQSSGVPVVAFNSGGVPYTLLDNVSGLLCEECNMEEMADKIAYLIENENKRIEMGKEGRKFVLENYSNTVISKKWKNIYTAI